MKIEIIQSRFLNYAYWGLLIIAVMDGLTGWLSFIDGKWTYPERKVIWLSAIVCSALAIIIRLLIQIKTEISRNIK